MLPRWKILLADGQIYLQEDCKETKKIVYALHSAILSVTIWFIPWGCTRTVAIKYGQFNNFSSKVKVSKFWLLLIDSAY